MSLGVVLEVEPVVPGLVDEVLDPEPMPPDVPLVVSVALVVLDGLEDVPIPEVVLELDVPLLSLVVVVVVVVDDGLEDEAPVFAARSLQPATTSNAAAMIA